MNVFKLRLKKNEKYNSAADQLYEFFSLYMGESGLEEIGDNLSENEVDKLIGEFSLSFFNNKKLEDNYIYGLVISEDNFKGLIQCLYSDEKKISNTKKELVLRWF